MGKQLSHIGQRELVRHFHGIEEEKGVLKKMPEGKGGLKGVEERKKGTEEKGKRPEAWTKPNPGDENGESTKIQPAF